MAAKSSKDDKASPSQSQGGDYKQYMQGAGDYKQYMQGAGAQKQYMKGAGDYKQYMQQSSQHGATQLASAPGTDDVDFQVFMKQYSSDYQKYMKQTADYQKYLKLGGKDSFDQYMKNGPEMERSMLKKGEDLEKTMIDKLQDYQNYLKQGGKFNFDQYMKQAPTAQHATLLVAATTETQALATHADIGQFMKEYKVPNFEDFQKKFGGGQASYMQQVGSYMHYVHSGGPQDFSEYMKQGGSFQQYMPMSQNMSQDDALKQYTYGYLPHTPKDATSPQQWAQAYMKDEAPAFSGYVNGGDSSDAEFDMDAPMSPGECHSIKELNKWNASQSKQIHTFVPKKSVPTAEEGLKVEYNHYKAKIERQQKAEKREKVAAEPKASGSKSAVSAVNATTLLASDAEKPQDWAQSLMKQNAPDFVHYMDAKARAAAKAAEAAPANVEDCHSMQQLKQWQKGQHAIIDAFVPKENQASAQKSMEAVVRSQQRRIEAEEEKVEEEAKKAAAAKKAAPTAAPATMLAGTTAADAEKKYASQYADQYVNSKARAVEDAESKAPESPALCRSLEELKAWRAGQNAQIQAFTPMEYRKVSEKAVEKEFKKHKARLQEEAKEKAEEEAKATVATKKVTPPMAAAAMSLVQMGQDPVSLLALVATFSAGAMLVAMVSRRMFPAELPQNGELYTKLVAEEP